jgi:hypothetical protein
VIVIVIVIVSFTPSQSWGSPTPQRTRAGGASLSVHNIDHSTVVVYGDKAKIVFLALGRAIERGQFLCHFQPRASGPRLKVAGIDQVHRCQRAKQCFFHQGNIFVVEET